VQGTEIHTHLCAQYGDISLGEPGCTSLYVGLSSVWGSVDGDHMFSPFLWEVGTLTEINLPVETEHLSP